MPIGFVPAALTALKGLSLTEKIGLAAMGYFGGEQIWSGLGERKGQKQNYLLGLKQLALQRELAEGQTKATKAANEADVQATQKYMNMLLESRGRERKERSEDRQMQLINAMMQGMMGLRSQAGQAAVDSQRQLPPMALTTLMRGM